MRWLILIATRLHRLLSNPPRHRILQVHTDYLRLVPHTWNAGAAVGTRAPDHPILSDSESMPLDQGCLTRRASSVLIVTDHSREVPRIDVIQPSAVTELRRSDQRFDGGIVRVRHLVVLMKRSHVPGDIRRNAGDE